MARIGRSATALIVRETYSINKKREVGFERNPTMLTTSRKKPRANKVRSFPGCCIERKREYSARARNANILFRLKFSCNESRIGLPNKGRTADPFATERYIFPCMAHTPSSLPFKGASFAYRKIDWPVILEYPATLRNEVGEIHLYGSVIRFRIALTLNLKAAGLCYVFSIRKMNSRRIYILYFVKWNSLFSLRWIKSSTGFSTSSLCSHSTFWNARF